MLKNSFDWTISSQVPNRERFIDYRNHMIFMEESRVGMITRSARQLS